MGDPPKLLAPQDFGVWMRFGLLVRLFGNEPGCIRNSWSSEIGAYHFPRNDVDSFTECSLGCKVIWHRPGCPRWKSWWKDLVSLRTRRAAARLRHVCDVRFLRRFCRRSLSHADLRLERTDFVVVLLRKERKRLQVSFLVTELLWSELLDCQLWFFFF